MNMKPMPTGTLSSNYGFCPLRHNPQRLYLKRVFDILFSFVSIVMLSPVLVIIYLIVRCDGGPGFFAQTRIGLNGRRFRMLKFRSMCVDAEQRKQELLQFNEKTDGITFKITDDPRITPIGRVLRRTSLDELPQLFNVFFGDMSIVGPRPCLPDEMKCYANEYCGRFSVKPGLTCLWQVGEKNGGLLEVSDRNRIGLDEQIRLDLAYARQISILRDIWIIIKTIPALFFGK